MSRSQSHKAPLGSDSSSFPEKSIIRVVGSIEAGGGAHYRFGDLAIDCGANPNGGIAADLHVARLVECSVRYPIKYLMVSHFHFDHYGGVGAVLKAHLDMDVPLPTIVCTDITWNLIGGQLKKDGFYPDGPEENYRSIYHVTHTRNVSLLENEHSVPGSAGLHITTSDGKTILYTGDFREFKVPAKFREPDLCILDCTGALKFEPTEGKEIKAREGVMALVKETFEGSGASVYVSTFSTQLERISWLEKTCRKRMGLWPTLAGISFLVNSQAYRSNLYGERTNRFVICSGVWGQPGSKLVRLSENRDNEYKVNPGDRVILSGSMPYWNPVLMTDINTMCSRLTDLGAEVILDSSVEPMHMPKLRRAEIHCSGHASFFEIVAFLEKLQPKAVFAAHGSIQARIVIERWCRKKGIMVISMNHLSEIAF